MRLDAPSRGTTSFASRSFFACLCPQNKATVLVGIFVVQPRAMQDVHLVHHVRLILGLFLSRHFTPPALPVKRNGQESGDAALTRYAQAVRVSGLANPRPSIRTGRR